MCNETSYIGIGNRFCRLCFAPMLLRDELDLCNKCYYLSKYYSSIVVILVHLLLWHLLIILKTCLKKSILLSKMSSHCSDNRTSVSEFFELSFAESSFKSSLLDDNDIDLSYYLTAYEELYKFCQLLGTVFSFVGSEIKSKMDILASLKSADENNYFKTMKSMVEYEIKNNLLADKNYVSGSRTLLRLHRGLDFLRQFLERVGNLQNHESTNNVGQEVYAATLAKYHSWLVRKGASMAMYVLPTREVLLQKVCGENYNESLRCLPSMLAVTNEVYKRTQSYLEEKDLLGLP